MEERLQKYMARCGIASRRKCEEIILEGKIKVNGTVITEVGTKINPEKDIVVASMAKVRDAIPEENGNSEEKLLEELQKEMDEEEK